MKRRKKKNFVKSFSSHPSAPKKEVLTIMLSIKPSKKRLMNGATLTRHKIAPQPVTKWATRTLHKHRKAPAFDKFATKNIPELPKHKKKQFTSWQAAALYTRVP